MTRLQEATRELTKILDEMLDFSELKAQRFELEEIPFDLCQTLASCFDLLAEQAQAKQLTFYCCVMSGVPKQVRGGCRARRASSLQPACKRHQVDRCRNRRHPCLGEDRKR